MSNDPSAEPNSYTGFPGHGADGPNVMVKTEQAFDGTPRIKLSITVPGATIDLLLKPLLAKELAGHLEGAVDALRGGQ